MRGGERSYSQGRRPSRVFPYKEESAGYSSSWCPRSPCRYRVGPGCMGSVSGSLASLRNFVCGIFPGHASTCPTFHSPDLSPEVGLPGPTAPLCFLFPGTSMLFSIVAACLCIPTQNVGGFRFPYTLCSICSLEIFLMMAVLTGGRGFLSADLISIDLITSGSSLVWLNSK